MWSARRSVDTAAMKGCFIPAPAPCARTRHAATTEGRSKRPETRHVSSTPIVTGSAVGLGTPLVWSTETCHAYRAGSCVPPRLRYSDAPDGSAASCRPRKLLASIVKGNLYEEESRRGGTGCDGSLRRRARGSAQASERYRDHRNQGASRQGLGHDQGLRQPQHMASGL